MFVRVSQRLLCPCVSGAGMNQFNSMAMQNVQMTQAPMAARAASPMNHPQQINISSVPPVSTLSSPLLSSPHPSTPLKSAYSLHFTVALCWSLHSVKSFALFLFLLPVCSVYSPQPL